MRYTTFGRDDTSPTPSTHLLHTPATRLPTLPPHWRVLTIVGQVARQHAGSMARDVYLEVVVQVQGITWQFKTGVKSVV